VINFEVKIMNYENRPRLQRGRFSRAFAMLQWVYPFIKTPTNGQSWKNSPDCSGYTILNRL